MWHPAEIAFDEVHFGKFVSAYLSGQYYFDIHPPLGKLLIAGFAKFWGLTDKFDFGIIGEPYNTRDLFILRFLPAFFGALFVFLVYQFTLALSGSLKAALTAGFIVLFDNAFLVESKFILIDSMLFSFGILTLWIFILSQRKKELTLSWLILFILSGLAAGATLSIKWTGVVPLALILSLSFLEIFRRKKFFSPLRTPGKISTRFAYFILKTIILLSAAALIYVVSFYIHFRLLDKSGMGDVFMTPAFQKTLEGNKYQNNDLPILGFWQKFIELNKTMYTNNFSLFATHPFSSYWYQWPLGRRPIYYWTNHKSLTTCRAADIWLSGNLFSWWLAALTVVIATLTFLFSWLLGKKLDEITFFLLFAYFANLLPFIFVSRVTFLYHYLPALTFAFILLAIKIDNIKQKRQMVIFFSFLILFFLIQLPLSYGLSLPLPFLNLTRVIIKALLS